MSKEMQNSINEYCLRVFNKVMSEAIDDAKAVRATKKQLRKCTAWVYETNNFFLLKSYSTYIACIDKKKNEIIDVLRYEYVYTNTSAQHIIKFIDDYIDKRRISGRLTWRKVK